MEQNNNSKNLWMWIVAVVVIVLIAVGFYASYRARNAALYAAQSAANAAAQSQNASQTPEQTIDIKHQYANGTHTYVGSIDVPTPCDKISADVNANPSNSNAFTLAFTTITPPTSATSTPCAQAVTSVPFKITFPGAQNAVVNATLDGQPAILNVFEVPAGQDINSAIYLKG